MKKEIRNIDGVTGVTLEGKRGQAGKRGGVTFIENKESVGIFSVFDIWDSEAESDMPLYPNIKNNYQFITPSQFDYVISNGQTTLNHFVIDLTIPETDLINETSLIKKYVEPGLISASYAHKIARYYNPEFHNMLRACCLCKYVSKTPLYTAETNINYGFTVNINTDSIAYPAFTGDVLHNEMGEEPKLNVANKSVEFFYFTISADNFDSFKKVKVEIEFTSPRSNGEMHSILPSLWSFPVDPMAINSDFPIGYIENYDFSLSNDFSCLDDFTIIVKDWNEMPENESTVFVSTKKIFKKIIAGYTGKIFVYSANNDIVTKTFIGEFSIF